MIPLAWRKSPLTGHEENLVRKTLDAHHASAFRQNVSSHAVVCSAQASGDYDKAIMAGMCMLGGVHAPLAATYQLLSSPPDQLPAKVNAFLHRQEKVPGWGNSFFKGIPDPLWEEVAALIRDHFPHYHERLSVVTRTLLRQKVAVLPNPSAYTTTVALILGGPWELAAYLFLQGRLLGWTELFAKNQK